MDSIGTIKERVASKGLKRFLQAMTDSERQGFYEKLQARKKGIDLVTYDSRMPYVLNPDRSVKKDIEERYCLNL